MSDEPIVILNQHLPPDPAPTGRLAAELLAALRDAGLPATGLAGPATYGRVDGGDGPDGLSRLPIDRVMATRFGRRGLLGKALDAASFLAGVVLRERLCADGPAGGTVVTMSSPPPLPALGRWLAARRGARLVIWCQDLWPHVASALGVWRAGGAPDRWARRLLRRAYGHAARVIALEPAMAARLVEFGVAPERVVTVPNWAPAALFEADPADRAPKVRAALGARDDQTLVLYSGNLGRVHEFETVLAAARALRDDERLRFVFAGHGPRRAEVARAAAGLPNVRLADGVPAASLAERLLAADVHLATLREGFAGISVPSKAASAWAVGRPTLFIGPAESDVARATRVAELGAEARNGDVASVVLALQELAALPEVCRGHGANARRWALDHHHPARNVPALVRAVRELG